MKSNNLYYVVIIIPDKGIHIPKVVHISANCKEAFVAYSALKDVINVYDVSLRLLSHNFKDGAKFKLLAKLESIL